METTSLFVIDCEAGDIICLVVSVCLCVCLCGFVMVYNAVSSVSVYRDIDWVFVVDHGFNFSWF